MTSETGNGSSAEGANKGLDANLPAWTVNRPTRHFRANRRWEENVTRVLGDEFEGKWSSIYEMMDDLTTAQPLRDQRRKSWTREETERVARLICWGLTNEMIGKIIGRTTSAICNHVCTNKDIVDVTKGHEEHVLDCQAPDPDEEEM